MLGIEAAKQKKSRIGLAEIRTVLNTYSRFRLNDIYKEHSHQYAGLEKLIETFSSCPARYTTTDILSQIATRYVNLVGAGNIPDLDGYPYKYQMQLAHFLYKIGFIVGRKDHVGDVSGGADFVKYEERQDLLSDMRNPDDDLLWEIHPAYRDALNIGKQRRSAPEAEKRRPSRERIKAAQPRESYTRKSSKKPQPRG